MDTIIRPTLDRCSTSGIFAFPPEILSTIFERGKEIVDVDPRYGEGRTPPAETFERLVSQTCPVFRNVALATPNLWTSLQVNGTCPLSWIYESLARSGSCLLNILVEDGQDYWLDDETVTTLISHSRRWSSLSLTCAKENAQSRTVTRICNATAPFLRYLSLQVTRIEHTSQNINDTTLPQIFKTGTPVLNFLRLGDWAMCVYRPPLQAIVTLHFDILGHQTILFSTFREIITSCPCIEHLSVNGDVIGRAVWPRRADVVVLPKLRSLRICGVDGGVYSGILLGFDTPMLQSLTLKNMLDEDLDDLWDLNDKSRYSNLTHLIFQDFDISCSTYRRLFKTFTDVTSFSNAYASFSIERTPIIPFLSDGIVMGREPPYYPWPKLRDLEFNFKDTEEEEEILRKLADDRNARGCPLHIINLRVPEGEVEELVEVEVNGPTTCKFVIKDELWPPNRNFIDYDSTTTE